jgi:hypothetical protein
MAVACRVTLDGQVGLAAAPLPRRRCGVATASPRGCAITVVLDGRLDDRRELLRRLTSLSVDPATASDADLVLAAYQQWGLDAAARLAGEFAWCLWDGRERRLRVRARPLRHPAAVLRRPPAPLAVSNAVTSLQRTGTVSDQLLDRAVGDLLVFGDPQEPGTPCWPTCAACRRRTSSRGRRRRGLRRGRTGSSSRRRARAGTTRPPRLSRDAAARRERSGGRRAGHGAHERRARLHQRRRAGVRGGARSVRALDLGASRRCRRTTRSGLPPSAPRRSAFRWTPSAGRLRAVRPLGLPMRARAADGGTRDRGDGRSAARVSGARQRRPVG